MNSWKKIKPISTTGLVTPLDVTSLFTNIPVKTTKEVIMKCTYSNEDVPQPLYLRIYYKNPY